MRGQVMLTGRFRRYNHTMIERRLKQHGVTVHKWFVPYADALLEGTNPKPFASPARDAAIPVIREEGLWRLMAGEPLEQVIWGAMTCPEDAEDASSALSELRSLVHDRPSLNTWQRIRILIDRLGPDDVALAATYVSQHIDGWPLFDPGDAFQDGAPLLWSLGAGVNSRADQTLLGLPPNSGMRAIARGEQDPRFELIRACACTAFAERIEAEEVFNNPQLAGVRALRVGPHMHAPSPEAVRGSKLELLKLHSGIIQEEHLRGWLDPGSPLRHLSLNTPWSLVVPPEVTAERLDSLHIGAMLHVRLLRSVAPLLRTARSLSVEGARLEGGPEVKQLIDVLDRERLTRLDLSGVVVGRRGVEAMMSAPWGRLTHLRASGSRLSRRAGMQFGLLAQLPELEWLDISDNALMWTGLRNLLAAEMPRLRHLNVNRCSLSPDLRWLDALPEVQTLCARNNNLRAADVLATLAGRRLSVGLERLDLRDNPLGGAVDALLDRRDLFPALRVIGLGGYGATLSRAEIDRLRAGFPGLQVVM